MSEIAIPEKITELKSSLIADLKRKIIQIENILKLDVSDPKAVNRHSFQVFPSNPDMLNYQLDTLKDIQKEIKINEEKATNLKYISDRIYEMKSNYDNHSKELEIKKDELCKLSDQKILIIKELESDVIREKNTEKTLMLNIENDNIEINTLDVKINKIKSEIENLKKNYRAHLQLVKKVESSTFDIGLLYKKFEKIKSDADRKREVNMLKLKETDDMIEALQRQYLLLEKEISLNDDMDILKSSGFNF